MVNFIRTSPDGIVVVTSLGGAFVGVVVGGTQPFFQRLLLYISYYFFLFKIISLHFPSFFFFVFNVKFLK